MRFVDQLSDGLGIVAGWIFFLTGLFLTYEVASRYLFNAPTVWAAEVSQLLLIWGVYLALGRMMHRRQNITIDFLYDRMAARPQRYADTVAVVITLVFALVIVWYGGWIALDSFVRGRSTGTMLNIPNWWSEAAVPLGFTVLCLQSVVELIRLWAPRPRA